MKKILTILIFCLTSIPVFVFASEVRIETNRAYLSVGDEFVVNVILSADTRINAVEGSIIFDESVLSVKEIREGNSVLNFWVEKPYVDGSRVFFSGITPGGLIGPNNTIFSLVFVAKDIGKTIIFPNAIEGLLHDGQGTRIPLKTANAEVLIREGDSNTYVENIQDDTAPEFFNPVITRDNVVFDNQYFISFSTQDKGSGVSYYQIKEYRIPFLNIFKPWKTIQSPYVLSDQHLKSYIKMRAVDYNNNAQVVKLLPQNISNYGKNMIYFIVLIILIFISCLIYIKKIKK